MRVLLVTEGTYPVAKGGVSTWCDHLIRSLPSIKFDLLSLTATGQEQCVWNLPHNVVTARTHGLWASPIRRRFRNPHAGTAERLLRDLWAAVLGHNTPENVDAARQALDGLIDLDDSRSIADYLLATGSARALAGAWEQYAHQEQVPPLTIAQATMATAIVDRYLATLSVRPESAHIVHATANGPCGLMALAHRRRMGSKTILTEHGIYLREQYLSLRQSTLDWNVRRCVTAFTRRISEVLLAEADAILPVSNFNRSWELYLGASEQRVQTILNGVDTQAYSIVDGEPEQPTMSFVGRIDPLKDLETLIQAHALVVQKIPGTRLRIFGPVPEGNESYQQKLDALVADLGTGALVCFEGPVIGARPAIEAGHVVALSSISEGMPYTLIESMMCGRATVSTDVGGVSECVGTDGTLGLVVPPRQPQAFAQACIRLLQDASLRSAMGAAAANAARERFSLQGFAEAYHQAYLHVVSGKSVHDIPILPLFRQWATELEAWQPIWASPEDEISRLGEISPPEPEPVIGQMVGVDR